jgi:hypothetical protein
VSPAELLRFVVDVLDAADIEYMITGSVASSLQGEPRATHDLDVVAAIEASKVHTLIVAFSPPRFYVDENAVSEAVRTTGMFNVINVAQGDKVDFWLFSDDPFDRSRFLRRVKETVFGIRLSVSSPEDTILAKLRRSKLSGGTTKPYIDALRVFEVQGDRLDLSYINDWSERLQVVDLWTKLQSEAELPD